MSRCARYLYLYEENVSPDSRDRKVSRFDVGRDLQSRIVEFMVRWAARRPEWRLQTMEVLVQSETEGIRLLEAALPAIGDRRLRGLLEQHLVDEHGHAMGFAGRFEALQKQLGVDPRPAAPARPQHLSMTIMELIAYLEIQELRGGQILGVYRELFEGDEESVAFIDKVLREEKFHATYTHLQLERWIDEGLDAEVEQARRAAAIIDRRAFWSQVMGFLRSLPGLLLRTDLPHLRVAARTSTA